MKEINIAKAILRKRKEKGVTQDELAAYIGVSKASVSKWETAQSYPDITFLPQLAAYFNISIDELIGYEPQMTDADIKKLYFSLCKDFSEQPFDKVMMRCREIIKKYFSCFPLLLQMGALIINYSSCEKDALKNRKLMKECMELFIRIKTESDDVELCRQAIGMEAFCHIMLGEAKEVLELTASTMQPAIALETLLANAHVMLGDMAKAKETMQLGFYQHIIMLIDDAPVFFSIYLDNRQKFEEILKRTLALIDLFEMDRLHPALSIKVYLVAAQGYCSFGDNEQAIKILHKYCEVITTLPFPLTLHGDDFFDLLDNWFSKLVLGTAMPRDEKTAKQSIVDAVGQNPAFAALEGDPRFKSIKNKLNSI